MVSLWDRYSENAKLAMHLADGEAKQRKQPVLPEHFLLAILAIPDSRATLVLHQMAVDTDAVRVEVTTSLPPVAVESVQGAETTLDPRGLAALDTAFFESRNSGGVTIRTEHLLIAILLERRGFARRVLRHNGVRASQLRRALRSMT